MHFFLWAYPYQDPYNISWMQKYITKNNKFDGLKESENTV